MSKQHLDMDKINRRLKSLGSGKYLKLSEGDNKLRILPRTDGSGLFYLELTQHYGFKDDNRGRAYACLDAMKGEECPVCEFWKRLVEEGEDKLAKNLEPRTVFLSNVVDRADGHIKIWSYSSKMLRSLANYLKDEDYGPEVLDEEVGYDFTISREGTGIMTRYRDPRISPKPRPIGVDDWEKKAFNLNREAEIQSYNFLVNALEDNYGDYLEELGLTFKKKKGKKAEDAEEDVEEEDERPKKKHHVEPEEEAPRKKKRAPVVEEEVEEELEEEDVGDEDEEEILDEPVKKAKKKGRK